MPLVSFYILATSTPQDRYLFACKLLEKAYRRQQIGFVHTKDHAQSVQIDRQLWAYKLNAFIPHQIIGDSQPPCNSILIGSQAPPTAWQQIILNLSSDCPDCTGTQQLLEIVDNNPEVKQQGRVRYRQYLDRGLTIKTHKV